MEHDVRGPMSAATDRTVLLVVGLWCAVWSLVPVLSELSSDGAYPVVPLTLGALVLLAVGVTTALGRAGSGRVLVAVMCAHCALVLALTTPAALPIGEAGYAAAWICTSAAIAAGMLLPPRRAVVVIVALGAAALVVWVATLLEAGRTAELWFEVPILVSFVVADGMAALTIVTALRRAARRGDRAAAELAAAEAASARDDALRTGLAVAARSLHETAVNTLGAISRGQTGDDEAALRGRARDDCAVLARLSQGLGARTPTPWQDPVWWHRRADRLGVALTLDVGVAERDEDRPSPEPEEDPAVAAVALAVAHEALVNAAGHGAGAVTVQARDREDGRRTLVVRDDGPGFDLAGTPRSAVWRYLEAESAVRGVDVRVESRPGAGTSVTATWTPTRAAAAPPPPGSSAESLATAAYDSGMSAVAGRFVGWLSVPVAACALGALVAGGGVGSLVAVVLYAIVVTTAVVRSRRRAGLDLGSRLALIGLGPVLVLLEGATVTVCGPSGFVRWAALGTLVALALLAWLGRPRDVVVGAVLALAATLWWALGEPDAVCVSGATLDLLADLVIVAALLAMRSTIGRYAQRAAEAEELARGTHAAEARRSEAGAVVAAALEQHLQAAATFLEAVAAGHLDTREPAVRQEAGALEAALRQVIALGTRLELFAPVVLRLLGRARDRGVVVDLRVGATPTAPPPDLAVRLESSLETLIDTTPAGESVTIGVFTLGDGTVLAATFPAGGSGDLVPGIPDVEVLDLGEQRVLEASWGPR